MSSHALEQLEHDAATELLDQLESLVAAYSLDRRLVYLNPAAERLLGLSLSELRGRRFDEIPELGASKQFSPAFARVAETGRAESYLTFHMARGRWFLNSLYRSSDRVWILSRDVTDEHVGKDRTARLQRVSEALSMALTYDQVMRVGVEQGVEAMDAAAGGLWLLDADGKRARLAYGFRFRDPEQVSPFEAISTDAPYPLAQAIRTGEPVWIEDPEQYVSEFPEAGAYLSATSRRCPIACVPLKLETRTVGALMLAFAPRAPFLEAERMLFVVLARHCALALERARLFEATERGEHRARFLAQASEILASQLDAMEALRSLTRLAVPTLGDWCAVDRLTSKGVERLAVHHEDPSRMEQARAFHEQFPTDLESPSGIGKVLRTGVPEMVNDLPSVVRTFPPEVVAQDRRLRFVLEMQLNSYLSVPLVSRGKVLGALTLVHAESGRRHDASDLQLATDLARRAAVALDNAQLYEEAKSAVEARDEFLSIASHELKTPLTPLSLKLQVLARQAKKVANPFADDVLKQVADILKQVSRVDSLVRELLDVSRIMSGRLSLSPERVELSELVREIAERHAEQADRVHSELRVECAPVTGEWDRMRLEQIITNLLDNALKYGAGAPIDVKLERQGDRAVLTVRDRGIGIAVEDQRRIFERFERAANRNYGGLGLGLYIVRTIVEAKGGRIAVASERGQGATFRVELPLSSVERREAPRPDGGPPAR